MKRNRESEREPAMTELERKKAFELVAEVEQLEKDLDRVLGSMVEKVRQLTILRLPDPAYSDFTMGMSKMRDGQGNHSGPRLRHRHLKDFMDGLLRYKIGLQEEEAAKERKEEPKPQKKTRR